MKNINVLYDYQIFNIQKFGGISKCFSMYIKEFGNNSFGINALAGCRYSNNHHLKNVQSDDIRKYTKFKGANRIYRLLNRSVTRRYFKWADILHYTFYTKADLIRNQDLITVSTVHDMIPELFPEYFPAGNPHKFKRTYCEKSDMIVCVSKQTRQDLIKLYNIPVEKTRIVYHGIDIKYVRENLEYVSGLPSEFLLFVGSRTGYKNFHVVLEAMKIISKRFPSLRLVCVGKKFTADENEKMKSMGINEIVVRLGADDRQLRGIYRKARAFIFPSLYEGFGIPILEAFAQNCPVILSSASCFPEIAEDAAAYFDPSSAESCAETVSRVLLDKTDILIRKSEKRCTDFTWEKTAKTLSEIYSGIARNK